MKSVAYVKRDTAGFGGSKGVKYDVVISEIRKALIDNGIVFTQTQVGVTEKIADLPTKSGGVQLLYSSVYKNKLVNIDDPTDFVEGDIVAHGVDNGDKAPGKTSTYSAKVFLVKVFSLESGDNDESRAEVEGRKNGDMSATGQECAAIRNLIKNVNPDNLEKCYEHLKNKIGTTKQHIEDGALTQAQAARINKILQLSAQKSNNAVS